MTHEDAGKVWVDRARRKAYEVQSDGSSRRIPREAEVRLIEQVKEKDTADRKAREVAQQQRKEANLAEMRAMAGE